MDDIYLLAYIVTITLVNVWAFYERIGLLQVVATIFGIFDLALLTSSSNVAEIVAFLIIVNVIILIWGVTKK